MATDHEVGQIVEIQRKNRTRFGKILRLQSTKAVIEWTELDAPSAVKVSIIPRSLIIDKEPQ